MPPGYQHHTAAGLIVTGMGWRNHTEIGPDRTVHVWPEDDLPHLTEPGDPPCWCQPAMEETQHGAVLVSHRDMLDRTVSS